MTKELQELVERARTIEMTPEQEAEQRRSFAYGNTHIENKDITRQLIEELDRHLSQTGEFADMHKLAKQ
jgi:hypothetical protein